MPSSLTSTAGGLIKSYFNDLCTCSGISMYWIPDLAQDRWHNIQLTTSPLRLFIPYFILVLSLQFSYKQLTGKTVMHLANLDSGNRKPFKKLQEGNKKSFFGGRGGFLRTGNRKLRKGLSSRSGHLLSASAFSYLFHFLSYLFMVFVSLFQQN